MTRNTYIAAALCLLAGGLAGCSDKDDEQPANNTWTLNVMATKSDAPATRALSYIDDGSTKKLTATWAIGETVDVRTEFHTDSRGTLTAQDNATKANLTGTINGTHFSTENTLSLWFPVYPGDAISYLRQRGTLADIAARFDYAHASVSVNSVDASNQVLTTTDATFVNVQAIVKFTLYDTEKKSLAVSEIHVSDGSSEIANATLNPVNSEVWLALPPVNSKTITLTATSGGNSYTFTTPSPVSFQQSHFYPINVKMAKVVPQD